VQVYEPMMVDTAGEVTKRLLFGSRYVKDNRLLPAGFDKATAPADVPVRGGARDDPDFTAGGDRVAYRIAVGEHPGPFTFEVELLYQTIAYRWAQNLRRHRAPEILRFLDYYGATAGDSPVRLAGDTAEVEANPRTAR